MKLINLIPWADWLALVCFFALWVGYAWFAKFWGARRPSLIGTTNRYRTYWMMQATGRDPRGVASSEATPVHFRRVRRARGRATRCLAALAARANLTRTIARATVARRRRISFRQGADRRCRVRRAMHGEPAQHHSVPLQKQPSRARSLAGQN